MKDGTACMEKDGRFFVLLPSGEPGEEYKLPPDPLALLPEVAFLSPLGLLGTPDLTGPQLSPSQVPKISWRRIAAPGRFFSLEPADSVAGQPDAVLTISSYNVMADVYSPPAAFPDHVPDLLPWMYRGPRVACELLGTACSSVRLASYTLGTDADVLALQELSVDAEKLHLRPLLARHGYQGIFLANPKKEGCALFWRTKT
jgi:hypothetical protein